MPRRKVELVLICEDGQHEAFARRFLKACGYDRNKIRVETNPQPPGSGAGDQWVRQMTVEALKVYRKRHVDHAVVAITDADRFTVAERVRQFEKECDKQGVPPRQTDEKVAFFVPKWEIEAWLAYLRGEDVDEDKSDYPKRNRQCDCGAEAKTLKDMCDRNDLRKPVPPSLEAACVEYHRRLRP